MRLRLAARLSIRDNLTRGGLCSTIPERLNSFARSFVLFCALSMAVVLGAYAQTLDPIQPPRLRVGETESNGWTHILGERATNYQVVTLSASSNLVDWEEIAVVHDGNFDFIDPATGDGRSRIYRAASTPFLWEDTNRVHYPPLYKNQVSFR